MTIKEIQLPIENLKKKLRAELKGQESRYALADGADSNFQYIEGKADGLRLALYILSKEEERLERETA